MLIQIIIMTLVLIDIAAISIAMYVSVQLLKQGKVFVIFVENDKLDRIKTKWLGYLLSNKKLKQIYNNIRIEELYKDGRVIVNKIILPEYNNQNTTTVRMEDDRI